MSESKLKILFLCTGNSCRSQMAEGWTRQLKSDKFDPYSAGTVASGLNQRAAKAMAEAGVDISGQKSKEVNTFKDMEFDFVITLCDNAAESCPYFPARTKVMHVGFDDPPLLAVGAKNEEEAMTHYRRIRDEIRAFIEGMPENLKNQD